MDRASAAPSGRVDEAHVQLVPLVPNVALPRRSSPRTRLDVPSGYGVQEQCLPFTAATALGLVIPSPIRFGHCPSGDVPRECRAFRSPLPSTGPHADWVFYVEDDPRCRFSGNAYTFLESSGARTLEPGISFFDRQDQQELFKLHLPYVWRTAPDVDTLFGPLLNRAARAFEVQSGLVETDWYANPVNMILRKSAQPIHCRAGDDVAQAVFVSRRLRNPDVHVPADHARLTRIVRAGLAEWQAQHAENRSAYKALARSRHGRID